MEVYDVPDPRRPIERLRRAQLREICLKKGIQLPSPMPPATLMRNLIEAEGGLEAVLSRPDKKVPQLSGERQETLIREGLEGMKMPDIRKLCSKQGVVWGPGDKKADLIERLLDV